MQTRVTQVRPVQYKKTHKYTYTRAYTLNCGLNHVAPVVRGNHNRNGSRENMTNFSTRNVISGHILRTRRHRFPARHIVVIINIITDHERLLMFFESDTEYTLKIRHKHWSCSLLTLSNYFMNG